jgi:uncharacterized protein (DUF305 family)
VELARLEEKEGKHPDARALADRIIKSRTAEVRQMGRFLNS